MLIGSMTPGSVMLSSSRLESRRRRRCLRFNGVSGVERLMFIRLEGPGELTVDNGGGGSSSADIKGIGAGDPMIEEKLEYS